MGDLWHLIGRLRAMWHCGSLVILWQLRILVIWSSNGCQSRLMSVQPNNLLIHIHVDFSLSENWLLEYRLLKVYHWLRSEVWWLFIGHFKTLSTGAFLQQLAFEKALRLHIHCWLRILVLMSGYKVLSYIIGLIFLYLLNKILIILQVFIIYDNYISSLGILCLLTTYPSIKIRLIWIWLVFIWFVCLFQVYDQFWRILAERIVEVMEPVIVSQVYQPLSVFWRTKVLIYLVLLYSVLHHCMEFLLRFRGAG